MERQFLRGNESLKLPNVSEFVTAAEYERRVKELIKCRSDPVYFANNYYTIISPKRGKHIIELYPKQADLIRFMSGSRLCCVLASRQCGKTTSYCVYALWQTMFYPDKKILICANKEKAARDFLARIKLAYELMPNWLQPGVKEWNKRQVIFGNDSGIEGMATSPDTARGSTANILILDEFSFVPPEINYEFRNSVFPVISSYKDNKIFMVSTPNGTANLFYETWNRAELGIDTEGWKSFKIDWWDVPDRDEAWKAQQIASLNGDMRAFNSEYNNTFFGSAYTLIEGEHLKKYEKFGADEYKEPEKIQFNKSDMFTLNVWERPQRNKTYIIGADAGEGIGRDFSVILVFDITDLANIVMVASFGRNNISATEFAYMVAKTGTFYRNAYVAMECNTMGHTVIQNLALIYEYENIVNYGSTEVTRLGILSHNAIKVRACIWLKDLLSYDCVNIKLNDKNLIYEMQWFERKVPSVRPVFQAVEGKNDDYMMSWIWAMYILNEAIVENYYNIESRMTTKFGIVIPQRIKSFAGEYYGGFNEALSDEEPSLRKIDDLYNRAIKQSGNPNVADDYYKNDPNISEEDKDLAKTVGFFGNESNDSYEWENLDAKW